MNIYLFTGILATVFLVIRAISSHFERKEINRVRAQNDEKQKVYDKEVLKLDKEIADAKLTFDINKRKLNNPPTDTSH